MKNNNTKLTTYAFKELKHKQNEVDSTVDSTSRDYAGSVTKVPGIVKNKC